MNAVNMHAILSAFLLFLSRAFLVSIFFFFGGLAEASQQWILGTTGCQGEFEEGIYHTKNSRKIRISEVTAGTPAEGKLVVGDLITGLDGKTFESDARVAFAKAPTFAESEAGRGRLSVVRDRNGQRSNVVLNVPVMGTYRSTAPYGCPKSTKIFDEGCEKIAEVMDVSKIRASGSFQRMDPFLNLMALLANGDQKFRVLLDEYVSRYPGKSEGGLYAAWHSRQVKV